MTEILLEELRRLASIEANVKFKVSNKTDLFKYYKEILLRLREEEPDTFYDFMEKGSKLIERSVRKKETEKRSFRVTAPGTMLEL